MGSHSLGVDSGPSHPDWHEIEDVLDALSVAARSAPSEVAFYRMLLDRIVAATGVSGGAIWTAAESGQLRLEYQAGLIRSTSAAASELLASHQVLVEDTLHQEQSRSIALRENARSPTEAQQGETGWAFVQRFRINQHTFGVIELVQRQPLNAAQREGLLRLLEAMVELTDDFHRQRELSRLRDRDSARGQVDQFALRVHRDLDAAATAYRIANEGRRVVGCDRLTVLQRRGRNFRTVAVSGVDAIDRRSKLLRTLERLVGPCMATGDPIWYCDGDEDLPGQIEQPLHAYLDESHARLLAIIPLRQSASGVVQQPSHIVGALVAEQFESPGRQAELRERLAQVGEHGGLALANSIAHSHMPLARVGRVLARIGWLTEARQLPKTVLALVAICLAVAGLTLIPADFDVGAKGELQPAVRRDVFASDDGVVDRLLVDHGGSVDADQALVLLRQPQLDLDLRRVAGEIRTAEKKLAALQAESLANNRDQTARDRDAQRLTAEVEEVKELLKGLSQQHDVLEARQADLQLRSPIGGQILTWNLRELLEARPVERGQALMTVGDLDGPWIVELHVPDDRAGHLLEARDAISPDLAVKFALASEPGVEYSGHVSDVALASEVDETTSPNVLVTVKFDRANVAGLRPGATVLAKVHCGRRSLGYVWFHEVLAFIQTHWWW